ncbi:13246_t:CDS:2 [Dentiscutata erythropus]|uniref:13246_t:CDS:1 n=1 Tax=Dentiscutata erythropus TaxID=1348616 RepID=A0A9N8Z957_9GLOM|nr:13246_t:CDS:2 [Dentiscutata erythropus]
MELELKDIHLSNEHEEKVFANYQKFTIVMSTELENTSYNSSF